MEKRYEIRGIDKIIGAVSNEDLARYFKTEPDADFKTLIGEDLKQRGVPSGLEIAGYEERNYSDMKDEHGEFLHYLFERYIKDGKAAIGITYPITKSDIAELYFYIDEPIKDEELSSILGLETQLASISILGYTMGKGFYERHKDEIDKFQEENGKADKDKKTFDDYVTNYFSRLSGTIPLRGKRSQIEKDYMSSAERLISQLTDGKSMNDVTLQDLENIKQALTIRQARAKHLFAYRFGKRQEQPDK